MSSSYSINLIYKKITQNTCKCTLCVKKNGVELFYNADKALLYKPSLKNIPKGYEWKEKINIDSLIKYIDIDDLEPINLYSYKNEIVYKNESFYNLVKDKTDSIIHRIFNYHMRAFNSSLEKRNRLKTKEAISIMNEIIEEFPKSVDISWIRDNLKFHSEHNKSQNKDIISLHLDFKKKIFNKNINM